MNIWELILIALTSVLSRFLETRKQQMKQKPDFGK